MDNHTNPRYIAYCQAHGRSAGEQLSYDREKYPGGVMAGFILWLGEKWFEWRTNNKRKRDDILSDEDHSSFDRYLTSSSLKETSNE
jgi:hypothetical protein